MIEKVELAIKKEFSRDLANMEWNDLARSAISAMCEPSGAMIEAGAETGPIGCCNPSHEDVEDIFSAMIDAALEETE